MDLYPTKAIIDLDALQQNYQIFQTTSGKEVFAVVKANAYGHGDVEVVKALLKVGVKVVCVASIVEALHLVHLGITCDILIFGVTDLSVLKANHHRNFIYTASSLSWLQQAQALDMRIRIHIELNTGMNRLGIKEWTSLKPFLNQSKHEIEGIYTHFSSSDSSELETQKQLTMFEEAVLGLDYDFKWIHASNSYGVVQSKDVQILNAVRVGIGLYGYQSHVAGLKPVLQLKTKIIHIDDVGPQETIGYNQTYRVAKKMKFATLPIGYADGISMQFTGQNVYINGTPHKVIGKVCMDQMMIEVDEHVHIGDEVEIFGSHQSAQDVAVKTGTIVYQLLTSISDRVIREYVMQHQAVAYTLGRNAKNHIDNN